MAAGFSAAEAINSIGFFIFRHNGIARPFATLAAQV